MNHNVLVVNPKDNVVIALKDFREGDKVLLLTGNRFKVLSDVPYGHKIAIVDIKNGSEVIKYGEPIGHLKSDVEMGDWIHLHNILIEEDV